MARLAIYIDGGYSAKLGASCQFRKDVLVAEPEFGSGLAGVTRRPRWCSRIFRSPMSTSAATLPTVCGGLVIRRLDHLGGAQDGMVSGHRGRRRPDNAIGVAVRREVLELVRDRYPDFGPTFACEKLVEVHG